MNQATGPRADFPAIWSTDDLQNVGHALTKTAKRMPDSIAVACPAGKQKRGQATRFDRVTFAQLETMSNQIARGVMEMGVQPRTRMALMVPPGIQFVAWVFGLLKAGAVIILIDPGMGRKNMIRCLAEARPEGMAGITKAHLARNLFRRKFSACRHNIVLGRWPGCVPASRFDRLADGPVESENTGRESEAAVIFTTGSTGPPKGVLYRHRVFLEQVRQIRDYFQIQPGTVDVSGFPLFALFNAAMGTTTVFPKMDATRPADIDPQEMIRAVEVFGADQSFGSPALWNTVASYCESRGIRLAGIKRVLTAGAPVPSDILKKIKSIISPQGEAFTPYGATESLPVACNSASVVLFETAEKTSHGAGTCVGHRFRDIQWKVISACDEPIGSLSECREVSQGEVGELIVKGPVVTDRYVTQVDANAQHKIEDGEGFWHRMGDLGYLDDQGRFWFCGRKSHRVLSRAGVLFTIPCEGIFNSHSDVFRSALVGVGDQGNQTPVMVVEPVSDRWPETSDARNALIHELKELGQRHWQTNQIEHFLFYRSLPVDIRHNSKIFREQLREWAANKVTRLL